MKIPLPKNFNPPQPLKIYDYQDVAFIIFTSALQFNDFSLQVFQNEQIIPSDWQLTNSSPNKGKFVNFSFLEGLNITIFSNKVVFVKKVNNTFVDLESIVSQFIGKFNSYNYHRSQAIVRRFISLPNKQKNSGADFIQNKLLNGVVWKVKGKKPQKQQINYNYQNSSYSLTLNVLDLPIKNKNIQSKSCLFFRGVFNYKPRSTLIISQNQQIISTVQQLPDDIKVFNRIIDQKLLGS